MLGSIRWSSCEARRGPRLTSCSMWWRRTASRRGYENRERQSNTDNSPRVARPSKDAITLPSVELHLTGSRQGNRGPPLPPPLIGCLCWLRHTGLAGPERPAPRAGQWRRLLSCHSAAESQSLVWSLPPLRALGDCWMGGMTTSTAERWCYQTESIEEYLPYGFDELRKPYLCSIGSWFFPSL